MENLQSGKINFSSKVKTCSFLFIYLFIYQNKNEEQFTYETTESRLLQYSLGKDSRAHQIFRLLPDIRKSSPNTGPLLEEGQCLKPQQILHKQLLC